jgi:hypothetical protein
MTKPEDATVPPAVGTPLEPSVGRLPDEATNACGPRGTYGCACKSRDAAECHRRRYGIVAGDVSHGTEECDCLCHHWSDDDE